MPIVFLTARQDVEDKAKAFERYLSAFEIAPGDGTVTVASHPGLRCERCWKRYATLAADPADVCERCATALKAKS